MVPIFVPFSTPGGRYVYDGNRNAILGVDEDDYEVLSEVSKTGDYSDNELVRCYQEQGYLMPSKLKEIKHPQTDFLEYYLQNCIEKITLQITQQCNLRCRYCAYSGCYEGREHSGKVMSLDTAKKAIDFLLEHSRDRRTVNIGFYGGEPLLEKQLVKQCVEYAEQRFTGKKLTFNITTNGTLLEDDIIEYFIAHDISVMISLDGPKETHDLNRVFVNGKGSFDTIIKNVTHVRDKYPEFFHKLHFNVVLAPGNDLKCVKEFYDAGDVLSSAYVRKTTMAEQYAKKIPKYEERFFVDSEYERFKLFLWLLKKISKKNVSKLFVQEFGSLRYKYEHMIPTQGLSETCHPAGPCLPGMKRTFITVDGKIIPCERVNEESEVMNIGDLDQGIDMEKVNNLLNIGKLTEEHCKKCWCFIQCNLCGASADDNKELSGEKKKQLCWSVKQDALHSMKILCFLVEHGFDKEHGFVEAYDDF